MCNTKHSGHSQNSPILSSAHHSQHILVRSFSAIWMKFQAFKKNVPTICNSILHSRIRIFFKTPFHGAKSPTISDILRWRNSFWLWRCIVVPGKSRGRSDPGESSKFYSPKSMVSPKKKMEAGKSVVCFFWGVEVFLFLLGIGNLFFARVDLPDSPRSNHWRLTTNCQLYTTNRHFWLCCMGQAHRSPLIGKKYSHLANPRSKPQE